MGRMTRRERKEYRASYNELVRRLDGQPLSPKLQEALFELHPDHDKVTMVAFALVIIISAIATVATVIMLVISSPALLLTRARSGKPRVAAAPGHRLLAFAEFFCSRRSVDEILGPTIDDTRLEYFTALAVAQTNKARWVRVRGTWSFANAAVLLFIAGLGDAAVKVWKLIR